jgi:hypothetical protein
MPGYDDDNYIELQQYEDEPWTVAKVKGDDFRAVM